MRPTRAGWAFFALTFGAGFAALNTGNNLLYLVLSLMLAFLVLSGVLSESALRGIEVRRHLPRELFASTPNWATLEIHNSQRRVAAFAVVVEDQLAGADASWPGGDGTRAAGRAFALRIAPRRSERRRYRLEPPRRGTLRLSGFRVSTRFPFGLFLKARILEAPAEVLVYPRLSGDSLRAAPRGASEQEARVSQASPAGDDVVGLRDFASGDPLRRVHWRSSLRRGALVVREVEAAHAPEAEVRLRTQVAPGEAFERSVERAASEAVAHLEDGSRVALRTDHTLLASGDGARQRARLLSFLARVEAGAASSAGGP